MEFFIIGGTGPRGAGGGGSEQRIPGVAVVSREVRKNGSIQIKTDQPRRKSVIIITEGKVVSHQQTEII